MSSQNPYYQHPQPLASEAADAVIAHITHHEEWHRLLSQGKMLGVMVARRDTSPVGNAEDDVASRAHILNKEYVYLVAYSGVVNGLTDHDGYFVPPIYDLQRPDDFYLQRDAEITALNCRIAEGQYHDETELQTLRTQRRELSIALQCEIFRHFDLCNHRMERRNILDIFRHARRALPPGGAGECAAPRLLHYAFCHGLKPLEWAEFWYGRSTGRELRIHGRFYPSCIEKCSPLLRWMLPEAIDPQPATPHEAVGLTPEVIYSDEHLIVVSKPSGLLSVPAKDLTLPNVETWLHRQYPDVHGPMLVHRLDQATSGLMLAARDAQTHKALQQQFEQKTISKQYYAELDGHVTSRCGIVSLPLMVNPDDRPRQVVDFQFGKAAVTYYEVVARHADRTVVRFRPLTGRTHQLRVHSLSSWGLGHPIVGDVLYFSSTEAHRLMLHAEQITFVHPASLQSMTFTKPINNGG